ncbi:hypothetical protein [Roseateles sp. P5_E8]
MGYGYRRRSYRSWRSRGYGRSQAPSKYIQLFRSFGQVVEEIRSAFFALDDDALDELFQDYGAIHGSSAEAYARKTFPAWKSRKTNLSGQTLERLVELVPPYLRSEQRMDLAKLLAKQHEKRHSKPFKSVRINIEEPQAAFDEIQAALNALETQDVLAHIPEHVMNAAAWLYDDDVTAARAVLAEATRAQNESMKASARRELEVLKRTILSGQVKAANYSVELPAGTLIVHAYTPPKGLLHSLFGWLK